MPFMHPAFHMPFIQLPAVWQALQHYTSATSAVLLVLLIIT